MNTHINTFVRRKREMVAIEKRNMWYC